MSAEKGTIPVLQRSQVVARLSLPFPIGIRFLKVQEGFIPFQAPRELSITMKKHSVLQEMGRITDGQGGW